jgi:predicted transcriptional regulator
MIDFACKKFSLEEVLRCSLNLSKAELDILKFLIKNKHEDVNTKIIQSKVKLDLTTVQRAVKKIYKLGILDRTQANLGNGGYVFSYKIKSKVEIKNKVIEIVDNWSKRVGNEFDKW